MTVSVLHSSSAEGRTALAAAVREARIRSSEMVVLHALSGAPEPGADAKETAAVISTVTAALTDIDSADDISWRVVTGHPDPDATATLLDLIETEKAEIVVVGSRHRSAVGKFLMGQPIQRLLLESRIPVLLVKSGS